MAFVPRIIGIGEALFDVFADGARLGGAPLNVALHAHQLGDEGVVVSRVGQDELGERVLRELVERGMSTAHIQTDPDRPTGEVIVDVDERGEPTYDILRHVAWDTLQFDFDLEDLAQRASAVCFGALAQRDGQSRHTIYRFLDAARRAVKLFDVNLRQDYYDRRILTRSFELADAVKLNIDELRIMDGMFMLGDAPDEAAAAILRKFSVKWVALTRGAEGTVVYTPRAKHEIEPVVARPGGDRVGAGDASAAGLLHGATRRWPWERTLKLANALGAHVASQHGACPPLSEEVKALI